MSSRDTNLLDDLTIGPVRSDEMDAVCAIAQVAWEPIHDAMVDALGDELHESLSPNWKMSKAEQIRGQFQVNPEWVLAVREGDTVVAFVTFGVDLGKSMGTIRNNAVHKDYQGRGIGTAMYRHVLEGFREAGLKYASVSTGLDPGHAPARTAYERVGFNMKREAVTYYQRLDET